MKNEKKRPRLVDHVVAEGEDAQQAVAVADASQAGIVDGVEVDFRHADLPPGEWVARPWWDVGGDGEAWAGVLFPSEAKACEETNERDEWIERKLTLPRAHPGDRLTVESVVDRIADRRFDHLHDATVKLAYLVLTRPDGSKVRPASPLAFYGKTQLRDGPPRDAYDRLAERILAEQGNPDPHAFEIERRLRAFEAAGKPLNEHSLGERAALAIEEAERAWLDLVTDHLKDDLLGQAALRMALNSATLAAFFQAKHELRTAERLAQRVAEGGDKARNKAKAKDNRFRYAQEIWSESPELSVPALARRVLERLYWEDDVPMIAESSMQDSLRAAVRRGDVAPPQGG